MPKLRGDVDDEIMQFRHIIQNSLARKLSKPDDGRYRPKHIVLFSIANKHHHLATYL